MEAGLLRSHDPIPSSQKGTVKTSLHVSISDKSRIRGANNTDTEEKNSKTEASFGFAHFGFKATKLDLSELALKGGIGDDHSHKTRHLSISQYQFQMENVVLRHPS